MQPPCCEVNGFHQRCEIEMKDTYLPSSNESHDERQHDLGIGAKQEFMEVQHPVTSRP